MLAVRRAAAADARAGARSPATGAVALAIVLGVQPFFCVANHVPGFSQAHNTRLAIVTLLCIALLAGWGLDDGPALAGALVLVVRSPSRRSGRAGPRRRVSRG